MTNFLPEEFRRELEGLQDAVPPRPYEDIEARIREELGKTPDELFAQFERRPIASASIGQVHLARLHDGRRSRSRCSTPTSKRSCGAICNTLRRIFRIVEWFIPYQGLDELYREIRAIVLEELDYRAEADERRAHRRELRGPHRRRRSRASSASCRPRACSITHFEAGVKITDKLGVEAARARSRPARAPGRRDLLPADLHRRRLSRRSAPRKSARPARRRQAGRRRSCSSISARSPRSPANVRAGIVELIQGALIARHAHASSRR